MSFRFKIICKRGLTNFISAQRVLSYKYKCAMVNILPEPEISDALDYAVVFAVRRVQLHAAPHPDRKLSRTTKSK